MAIQSDLDVMYMRIAYENARMSKATRAKVGACLVTPSGVLLTGWNGTPAGWHTNDCENNNVTKPEVIHAELNCILKAAKQGVSVLGSTVYVTLSPCEHCSGLLLSCGVKRVLFHEPYRDKTGVENLIWHGIEVVNLERLV